MIKRPEVTSFIIPPSLLRVLDAIATRQERSRSGAVRAWIKQTALEMNIPIEEIETEPEEMPEIA